jgi:internalin A
MSGPTLETDGPLCRESLPYPGLVHLKGLIGLKRLFLGGTKVTDAGLVHLKGLSRLQLLEVGNTRITDTAVRELQEALPNLKISRL